MCCYWNHLYCTTLPETLLSCQRIGHFLQQMMLCELCAATGTIIYCTSLPQTLEFLTDLDTFCSRWCCVSTTFPETLWVLQELETNASDVMWPVCAAATGTIIYCTTLPQLFEVLKLDTSAADFMWGMCCLSNNVLHPVCKQNIRVIRKVRWLGG
jgi:hypothetical protein